MTVSQDRIRLIRTAVELVPHAQAPVTPTQAQIDAAFATTKAAVMTLVQQLVPSWLMDQVNITDDELHAISDPTASAVVNATGA
jgi:hypothetical protein